MYRIRYMLFFKPKLGTCIDIVFFCQGYVIWSICTSMLVLVPCKFLEVNFLFQMSLMWFFCQDIQVYRYYRDLINFKTRGNPALMLRCINPNEAKILDAASGVHVKFRLAGVSLTQSSPKLSFYWDWGENSLVILICGIMLAAFSSVHAGSGQPLILGFGY